MSDALAHINPGNELAQIAETQIGTRGDLETGREALYGYLLATDANLTAFEPEWARRGFGTEASSRYGLLNRRPDSPENSPRLRLLDREAASELPAILRIHSWCAAFVDWCVLQLLLSAPHTTLLPMSQRPRTASAFGLLHWGRHAGCTVLEGSRHAPERGDIVVFTFSHTGIVTQAGLGKHFISVEGNTTRGMGGNQGYLVEKRLRSQASLKGFVRLPPRYRLGDFNISSSIPHTA
jgi:hypothetical protein